MIQSEMMNKKNPVKKGSKRPDLSDRLKLMYKEKLKIRIEYLMDNTFVECEDFKTYANRARAFAYRKRRETKDEFVIDHIFTVKDEYINKVPLPIISHDNNLRLISKRENREKGSNSLISLEELYKICEIDRY